MVAKTQPVNSISKHTFIAHSHDHLLISWDMVKSQLEKSYSYFGCKFFFKVSWQKNIPFKTIHVRNLVIAWIGYYIEINL